MELPMILEKPHRDLSGRTIHRISFIAVILFSIFLILSPTATSCGEPKRWSKEWEEDYEKRQPSEKIMDAIGVKPGMVVGEVGAGNGRFTVKVAARVGESGKVLANDIDEDAINFMKKRCKREKIKNMVVVEGKVEDPLFPVAALDMVYMINTYHHLAKPVELLKNFIPSLKAGGLLAIIDRDPERLKESSSHYTRKQAVLDQAKEAGFELVRLETFLPEDNIYIFCLREPEPALDKE